MNMIKVEMTVREALALVSNGVSLDMYERVVTALEAAMGIDSRRVLTITSGMNTDNRIPCIKIIRELTGWDLRKSKNWTDVLVGHYGDSGWVNGGKQNSMTLNDNATAKALLEKLMDLGCQGFLS